MSCILGPSARVPLCYVVVGGYSGALPAIRQAVTDSFPVMILKVLSTCTRTSTVRRSTEYSTT